MSSQNSAPVVLDGETLDIPAVRRVAEQGAEVALTPQSLAKRRKSRACSRAS